jgi:two-component system OmpR family sensor kinase
LEITGEDAEVLAAGTGRPVVVEAADGTDWLLMSRDVSDGLTVIAGVDLDKDDATLARLVALQVIVGLVILVLLGSAAYVLVRNSLRPLTEVERTARAIAAGDLSQRVPAGDEHTEVGRLSLALNGMLARIERSFRAQQASEEQARASETRMRRFVADASHELRTPLTSIRGFAELYRQGAVGSPEETARLMQRIESEGARMGVLVEDLLQLARLDQQRPLTITPVDLAEVAGDAVHDARAVQPDRPISLHLDESLSEVPVVLGDEARLRQVVSNLVTNALVHTPRTAPVTVRISDEPAAGDASADGDDGGVVVLQVADQGPGMAPEDAARVFERFYRADPSRARTAGGTGLGLAIVSALVAAHGGTVHLDTASGRGAAFTVRLPRSGPGSTVPPVPGGPAA